jgi:hypothetical protein
VRIYRVIFNPINDIYVEARGLKNETD